MPRLRWTGPLGALTAADRAALADRATSDDAAVRTGTAAIIARVRADGDMALHSLARAYDGVDLDALEVPVARCRAALDRLEAPLRSALERAAANLAAVHEAFRPHPAVVSPEPGVVVGRRPDPLDRVGIYAPGGRAAYPSSVLMGAVPARVAGVAELVLCSPPGPEGEPPEVVLAAAALAGVDRVFALGGAGAIAAMAYGTTSVPRVDRIVGPGNAWVTEAKLQVSGAVAIDSPAGPSELLILADGSADPEVLAREMLAQAEHDPRAAVVTVIVGGDPAQLLEKLGRRLATEPRAEVIRAAFAARGAVLSATSLAEAVDFANTWAAEHLLLATTDNEALLPSLRNAGAVFVGLSSSVVFGDYLTGANHVLPTGGLARCYSGLSTLDFVRWTTWQRVETAAAARLAPLAGILADSEGLPAHAAAARQWEAP
jgi:histidinol dehydrogenase